MKKRILGILLTLCMALGLISPAVFAQGGTVKTAATEAELLAALADSAAGTVRLTADIKLNNTLSIGRAVTLDLNGRVLGKFYKSAGYGPSICVESEGALTLIDGNPAVEHRFSSGYNSLWRLDDRGDKIVNGGVITGEAVYLESGVHVKSGGSFIMKGGNIVGCLSSMFNGAGVRAEGSFTMTGGNIMGCRTAELGGGVYASGVFTMTGGSISQCKADLDGDGIYLNGSGVMYANGGEVGAQVAFMSGSKVASDDSLSGVTLFKDRVENKGTVEHGTFSGEINSFGTISGGTFGGKVTNTGVISGGIFSDTGSVANKIGSTISGGAFNGTVTVEVVIDADNGSENIIRDIPRGQTFPKLDDPEKADYSFIGWYIGDRAFYFDEPLLNAAVIKARWVEGPLQFQPRIRINPQTKEWEVSYDDGYSWTSLGVKAVADKGDKGDKGQPGNDGTTPQLKIGEDNFWYVSYDGGQSWISLGVKATGENGKDGTDGKNGTDGADGRDGQNGKDGQNGTNGVDGKDGRDGIGIAQAKINADGELVITYTDGTTVNLGKVVGADGKDGLSPFIGENGNWWIGEKDTGVKAAAEAAVPASAENISANLPALIAAIAAGLALLCSLGSILYIVLKKKKGLV